MPGLLFRETAWTTNAPPHLELWRLLSLSVCFAHLPARIIPRLQALVLRYSALLLSKAGHKVDGEQHKPNCSKR